VADPPGRATAEDVLTGRPGTSSADLAPTAADAGALAERSRSLAEALGLTVATAESCTGGLVGHLITAIPGSSSYYRGGFVTYADAVKVRLLGVPTAVLERHGAVSAQVAKAMAEGARASIGADLAVAVTGVAGPAGGSEAKPVGLTYVAVAGPRGSEVRRYQWTGDRPANKGRSAEAALRLLVETMERMEEGSSEDQGPGSAA
jgi:PncC family amidohydrolase